MPLNIEAPQPRSALSSLYAFTKQFVAVILLLFLSTLTRADCIGVVTAGGGVDFWAGVEKGVRQAAEKYQYDIFVRGPTEATTSDSQKKIIEQMIEYGCKALVVAPNTRERIAQLHKLSDQGVKSVLIDRNFDDTSMSVVKTNNFNAGAKAAHAMMKHLEPEDKIGIFRLSADIASTTDRERGFFDTITKAGYTVAFNDYIGTSRNDATVNAFNVLHSHPELKGIFTPNESTTLAVLNMRQRLENGASLVHIGFDAHPKFLRAIEENRLTGIVVQAPEKMGYLGVEKVIQKLKGQTVPLIVETPTQYLPNL